MQIPSMADLLEAGVHFGHQVKRWNPKMKQYIFTARDGVHVLDLAKTVEGLEGACQFVEKFAQSGGTILFLGTKRQARDIIIEEAKRSGAFYVSERWIGGFITNFDNVFKNIEKLNDLKQKRESGEFENLTKKEQLLIYRQINKLEKLYGGVSAIQKMPEAIFIIDCKRQQNAVLEANRRGVTTVAICDTNVDPTFIDHPIPGNDDAIKAIKIITTAIADAYLSGRHLWEKKSKEEQEQKEKEDRKAEKAKVAEENKEKVKAEKAAKKEAREK